MRGVSDRFLETLRGSHKMVARARVCTTFQTGNNPTGTEITISGGDVKCSASNMIRSTLELVTKQAWPRHASDLLTPFGQEIYVERGIAYGNGQREFVGLGYFRINTPEQDEVPEGEVTVSCADRMAGIVDARFLQPRSFPANMTRGLLVQTLITEVYPAATIEWDSTVVRDGVVGRTVFAEEDRAQCLTDFVTSLGKVGFWDHRGVFVVRTPPSITGSPAWEINAGENGVMVRMSRGLTRERTYNAYVVTGEAGDTTPPARGIVLNMDSTSPTYYYGPFGPVPAFYSSPFITSNGQALTAGAALLRKQLGIPYQVNLGLIVNPALEPYDVIAVSYPRSARNRSLRTETHVIDELTIPLVHSQAMTLQTREQQTELIGELE